MQPHSKKVCKGCKKWLKLNHHGNKCSLSILKVVNLFDFLQNQLKDRKKMEYSMQRIFCEVQATTKSTKTLNLLPHIDQYA